MSTAEKQPGQRTAAEWVTLGVSLLITLVVVGLLVYDLMVVGYAPPVIDVAFHYPDLRQEGDHYYLPVEITNQGGRTSEDVTVQFDLQQADGHAESTSLTIRFLAPGERAEATLLFETDPATARLTHTTNYLHP